MKKNMLQADPYLLEFNASVLVADYLRYKEAMENWRQGNEPREYWQRETEAHHTLLFQRAPKYLDEAGITHIFLPAHGKMGETYHLPRYRIYSKDNQVTIQLFLNGDFLDLPEFEEELVEHLVRLDSSRRAPALLYGEPFMQY